MSEQAKEPGNRHGWTFDTAMITTCVALAGIIVWVKTARTGDSKAVEVALVSTTSALSDTAESSRNEFAGVRGEIKELAKAVAEGLSGLNTALKLISGLAAVAGIGALIFFQ